MDWHIRLATSEDASSIVDMIRMGIDERAFHNREVSVEGFLDWAFTNRQAGYDLFLCQIGNEVVGYIDYQVGRRGVGQITGIYVKPEHRRKGIGEILIEKAIDQFLLGDCHKARLKVFAYNQGAISFYSRCNFVQEGHLRKDEGKRDALIMSRFLD